MGKVRMGASNLPIPRAAVVAPAPITIEVPVIEERIVYIDRPVEIIKTVVQTVEVPVEVVRIVTNTVEVPVEVIKERNIFVDRPVEVIKEVKIIDIEKLLVAQAEIRNLKSDLKTRNILLLIATAVAIVMGMK